MTKYERVKRKVRNSEELTKSEFNTAMLGNAAFLLIPQRQSMGPCSVLAYLCNKLKVDHYGQLEWLYGGW